MIANLTTSLNLQPGAKSFERHFVTSLSMLAIANHSKLKTKTRTFRPERFSASSKFFKSLIIKKIIQPTFLVLDFRSFLPFFTMPLANKLNCWRFLRTCQWYSRPSLIKLGLKSPLRILTVRHSATSLAQLLPRRTS